MKLFLKVLALAVLAAAVVLVGKLLLLLVAVAVVGAMILFLLKGRKEGEYYDPEGYDPEIDTEDWEAEDEKPTKPRGEFKGPKLSVKGKLEKRKADKVIADLEKQFKQ